MCEVGATCCMKCLTAVHDPNEVGDKGEASRGSIGKLEAPQLLIAGAKSRMRGVGQLIAFQFLSIS